MSLWINKSISDCGEKQRLINKRMKEKINKLLKLTNKWNKEMIVYMKKKKYKWTNEWIK